MIIDGREWTTKNLRQHFFERSVSPAHVALWICCTTGWFNGRLLKPYAVMNVLYMRVFFLYSDNVGIHFACVDYDGLRGVVGLCFGQHIT